MRVYSRNPLKEICQVTGNSEGCRRNTLEWRLRGLVKTTAHLGMALLTFFFAVGGWAGEGGRISGTVTDASGAVVAQAEVMVTNAATGVRHMTATDERGFY